MTAYTGAASQLPDPDYEAAVGAANAPAYRGRGSVFIKSLQLGGGGQIPNLTFEVVASGTPGVVGLPTEGLLCHFDEKVGDYFTSAIGPDFHAGALSTTVKKFGAGAVTGYYADPSSTADNVLGSTGRNWRAECWHYVTTTNSSIAIRVLSHAVVGVVGEREIVIGSNSIFGNASLYAGWTTSTGGGGGYDGLIQNAATTNAWNHFCIQYEHPDKIILYINGKNAKHNFVTNPATVEYFRPGDSWFVPEQTISRVQVYGACDEVYFHALAEDEPLYGNQFTPPTIPYTGYEYADVINTITANTVTLQNTVSALTSKTGLISSQFDVSALSATTRPVHSLAISAVSSARTVLDMLASTYQFECVLSDKLYFKPRGSAPVATLTFDEFGVAVDSSSTADPLPLTMANELEIPAQLALTYSNIDGDYQTDTQYSDRLLTGMESTAATQVPMGFTASEAKQIADTMLMDKAVSALSTTITLDTSRAALQPTDVILLTGEDASSYRMRIVKRTDAGGVTTLACVADDASILTQAGTTSGGTASQTTVAALATTTLQLMDIPLLRDVDSLPGFYVAVTGSAANWTSCAIYDSLDDLTYSPALTMADQAALGTCTTTLGNWTGGNTFDEANTVTVNVGAIQQLASVTRDDILTNQGINAALIGSELVQYRTATLVSAGVYTLSGFLRGRRGTEWAQTGHTSGERFVALGTSGLRFVPLQSGDLGRQRYYKAASAGQKLSAVTAQPITPTGVALECFSPVNARANRTTADTVLTWTRRTRLSTRLVGTLPINAPLGETTEAYEVEVWDSSYTTLKRTLIASTASVIYTSAQQVTDFGSTQVTLYLKIYQLSATVGRGYPLTVSI